MEEEAAPGSVLKKGRRLSFSSLCSFRTAYHDSHDKPAQLDFPS